MTAAVERTFKRKTKDFVQGKGLEGCLQLWRDFARTTDIGRTRKPETWAAALLYTWDRLQVGQWSQEDVADLFKISAISVSKKYRDIAHALDLKLMDVRYLPEATRMAVRREWGNLPEDMALVDAPTGFWHLPFGLRSQDVLYDAQELVYDGLEALESSLEKATQLFRRALAIDPFLADAHNGLGYVAAQCGAFAEAEAEHRRAYELARDTLGTESPRAFYWWGQFETRPYMRARAGVAWMCWEQGRFQEAIHEFEALLRLNPNDNQGARYMIAPLYQLAGDVSGALQAYAAYFRDYPDDVGDPHLHYCYGLALLEEGRAEEAVQCWYAACFQNIYIPPLLLHKLVPEVAFWVGISYGWRDHAEEYVEHYKVLWTKKARALLGRLWDNPDVKQALQAWIKIGQQMYRYRERLTAADDFDEARWKDWYDERKSLEEQPLSRACLDQILRNV